MSEFRFVDWLRLMAMVLALIVANVALVTGCSGRAAGVHVEMARAAGTTIDAGGEAIAAICTVEALRAAEEPLAFGEACETARDAQHVAVELWELWVELGAEERVDVAVLGTVAGRLVETWAEVVTFAAQLGRELPALEVP